MLPLHPLTPETFRGDARLSGPECLSEGGVRSLFMSHGLIFQKGFQEEATAHLPPDSRLSRLLRQAACLRLDKHAFAPTARMTKLGRQAAGFPTSLDLFDKSVQEKSPKNAFGNWQRCCSWKILEEPALTISMQKEPIRFSFYLQ